VRAANRLAAAHGGRALAQILERAAADGLPPIAWTVATVGVELRDECVAHPVDARRPPERARRRRSDRAGGSVARSPGAGQAGLAVIIALTADLYAEG